MFSAVLGKNLEAATTYDVFKAASVDNAENFIPNEKVDSNNVVGVMKVVVCSAIGKVPGIGSLFSGLLKTFWPDGSNDIWNKMKDKIEAMINDKIDANNAQQHRDRLQGLYLVLRNFEKQPPSLQAQRFPALLNIILHDAPAFLNDDSPWRSLPYVVFFGTLYISALWTQWKYCEKIHSDEKSKEALEKSKAAYEKDLIEAVQTLQAVVAKGKEACIARRKEQIKVAQPRQNTVGGYTSTGSGIGYQTGSGSTTITHEVEDPHTQIKLTITGDISKSEVNKQKLLQQLHHEIDSKYGAELDNILAPSRFWSFYLPQPKGFKEPHQYLEFPGWVWNGITEKSIWFDFSGEYNAFGDITRIDYYHGKNYYGKEQVFGVDIFFGGTCFWTGCKRGERVTFELGPDEVILDVMATGTTVLEAIGFSKARQTTDIHGRTEFGKRSITSNVGVEEQVLMKYQNGVDLAKHPEMSSAHAEVWHNGEYSKPHPMRMLYACGWHVIDPQEGHITLFQPVFGCKETIESNGKSVWS